MSKIDTSVLNEHKKPINKYEKLLLNCKRFSARQKYSVAISKV